MRKKQILVLLLIFTFLSVGTMALFTTAAAAPAIDYGPEAIDATPEMIGEDEVAMRKYATEVGAAVATEASISGDPAVVGEELVIPVANFAPGQARYDETFVVVMNGVNGVICVAKEGVDNFDAVTDEYVFANPSGTWRLEDRISTAQLAYLLNELDTNMYPVETAIYGDLISRGSEEDGHKVWVLIHNIRDVTFYADAESYVAGYFSSSENAVQNKNMFHIDTYDWLNRIGSDGARPYLYEGVFAHEFEHMIHFDQDSDEPSWVDEGLADLAAFFCGYGHADGHIDYYFRRHWYTSLTFWGGNLEDYGVCYLFQLYLYDHFGGAEFISALVQEPLNGIEGIEATLAAFGYTETFDDIFDAWTIANYMDDTRKAGGKYGYYSLEIGGVDTRYNTLESWMDIYHQLYIDAYGDWLQMFPFYETPFQETWWQFAVYGDPLPYTAQYFRFNSRKAATVWLDGNDFAGVEAYSGNLEWHSGDLAWAYRSFYQTFVIPEEGANLYFQTNYDIELDWDYGYVEVYDVTDDQWYTLEDLNGNTIDFDAEGQTNPNCPDGRQPMDYDAAGNWNAFTGNSYGWVEAHMDLTPFAEHTIELHFRLWQDGAFTLLNMYVDDISIPELSFFDDVEAGEAGWLTDGWTVTEGKYDNGFGCVVFDVKEKNHGMELTSIRNMPMDFATQSGYVTVSATRYSSGHMSVAVCTNHADHIIAQAYTMGAD